MKQLGFCPPWFIFDEEVLPHFSASYELCKLIKYIQDTFGFEMFEGYVPTATERFSREVRTANLSHDAADYIERALSASLSLGSCEEQLDSEYAGVLCEFAASLPLELLLWAFLVLDALCHCPRTGKLEGDIWGILNLEGFRSR